MATVIPASQDIQEFNFNVNLLDALLWQYNDAVNIQGLLAAKNAWYETNQTAFWENWETNVFNLATADQFGLTVWSIILGLPLYVNTAPPSGSAVFGFDGSLGSGAVGLDQGIMIDQSGSSTMLPIETQRIALQLRYFQLVSSGTVPETNRMLKYVFKNYGNVFLEDYQNMTQAYVFTFSVTWDLAYIFNNYDILPRPAGVASQWIDSTLPYFGFNGSGGLGLDQAILFG